MNEERRKGTYRMKYGDGSSMSVPMFQSVWEVIVPGFCRGIGM